MDDARAAQLAPITKRVLDEIDERRRSSQRKAQQRRQAEVGGAGGATTWEALLRADRAWSEVKEAASAAKNKRASPPPPPEFVTVRKSETVKAVVAEAAGATGETTDAPAFDVAVAGGTLGVLLAAALTSAGLSVAVVEAGPLKGRDQEWNICREELDALVAAGAISPSDAAGSVIAEFNPVRCAFSKGRDDPNAVSVVTTDVLNLGVSPDELIRGARRVVEGGGGGGEVFEFWPLRGVSICRDGVVLSRGGEGRVGEGGGGAPSSKASTAITARLFIDCMGSGSPAARQARAAAAARGKSAVVPDGVCMVAGTCARGPWPSDAPSPRSRAAEAKADVIAAIDGAELGEGVSVPGQFFWESFPAGGGSDGGGVGGSDGGGGGDESHTTKTTYMFQYSDLDRCDLRPSLVEFVEEYWTRVRSYQGLDDGGGTDAGDVAGDGGGAEEGRPRLSVEDAPFLVERVLFGVFYTYRDSPLRAPPTWDRFLFAGDAAGLQSPLSFGGLGSLTRHASRMRGAVSEAIACDATSASDLALINSCYAPNLSGSWMLQRAMAARPESPPPYDSFVVDLLQANFKAMRSLGDETLRPFLRDVVRLDGLTATLARQMVDRPDLVLSIVRHVGLPALLDWTRHYVTLAVYTALAGVLARPLLGDGRGGGKSSGGKSSGGDDVGGDDVGFVDACSLLSPKAKFRVKRVVEALEYGSGLDWVYKSPTGKE